MIRLSMPRIPSLVLLALLSTGCLNDSHIVAPESSSLALQNLAKGRPVPMTYPMAVGNRWVIRHRQLIQVSENGGPLEAFSDFTMRVTYEMFCEQIRGNDHRVHVAETQQYSTGATSGTWVYRQDRHGLWRPSRWIAPPPGCEPPFLTSQALPLATNSALRRESQPERDEALVLAYPLFVGRTWLMGDELSTRRTVEAYERVDLPFGSEFAYRIRVERPNLDPNSRSRWLVWYGKSGYLKTFSHGETVRTNPDGSTQRWVFETTEIAESIQLVGPGSSTAIRALGNDAR